MNYLRLSSIVLFLAAAAFLVYAVVDSPGSSEGQPAPSKVTNELERYDSLEDASRVAGFTLPPVTAPGWSFVPGTAYVRKLQLSPDVSNTLFLLGFNNERGGGFELTVISQEAPPAIASGRPQALTLANGQAVTIDRGGEANPNLMSVSWNKDGRAYQANGFKGDYLSEAEFLAALASLN